MTKLLLIGAGIALTVLCWGMYGPVLHEGQAGLGNDRFKPLICVGAAYMVVAIIVPVAILASSGQLMEGWHFKGITWSVMAGTAGAFGALGIILALSSGGKPIYVMPIVFGGAPVINVMLAMYWSKAYKDGVSPWFLSGLILVSVGAAMVLIFQPRAPKKPGGPDKSHAAAAKNVPAPEKPVKQEPAGEADEADNEPSDEGSNA